MGQLVAGLEGGAVPEEITFPLMLILLAHSVGLGSILVLVTYFQMRYLKHFQEVSFLEMDDEPDLAGADGTTPAPAEGAAKLKEDARTRSQDMTTLFLGATNLLFLCVGLTGIMLMINNNLVRAFAVVAAISLVRFRIKLDQKSLTATLLFSMLAGIACGLQEVTLAWTVTVIYVVLFAVVMGLATLLHRLEMRQARHEARTVAWKPALHEPDAVLIRETYEKHR